MGIPECSVDFSQTPCIGGGGVRRCHVEANSVRRRDREVGRGASPERRIENLQQVGSGDTDTIRPLPRERLIGRDTAGEAATRPGTSHKEGSGGSPDHRISEISSVARRTLRSVWPDRGALPEVRGRADRVGSLADGQGDRNGP